MSNRCPDCNKFVSLEQQEPEEGSFEVDDTGEVTGEVRLVLTCAECGTEMKEANLDVTINCPPDLDTHIQEVAQGAEMPADHLLSVEVDSMESTDRFNTKDRHGRPIKSFRYQSHFYGASGTVTISCSCGESFEVEFEVEEQAGSFDDLV